MNVEVVVMREGDGWLSVDTGEWIEEKLGERDAELSDHLREWADANCVSPTRCTAPADWARARFGEARGPEDDTPFLTNSVNQETMLTEAICVMLLRTADEHGVQLTLAVVDHDEVFVLDPMREWSDVIDWSRAFGRCRKGHTCVVESACYLHSDHSQQTHRVTELCREHEDGDSGYVACPDCGEPIDFMA